MYLDHFLILLMIPTWIFFPEIVFSRLWLWIPADREWITTRAAPEGARLILGKLTRLHIHWASVCWHCFGSHASGHQKSRDMKAAGTPKTTAGCPGQSDLHINKTAVWVNACTDGGVGRHYESTVDSRRWLYSLKEMKQMLDGVSERYWGIFWKSRRNLIIKLIGQNGSGELNKGSLRTPLQELLWWSSG